MDMEQRVARLERENRRLKLAGRRSNQQDEREKERTRGRQVILVGATLTVFGALLALIVMPAPVAEAQADGSGHYRVTMGNNASGLGSLLTDSETGATWRLFTLTDIETKPFVWLPVAWVETDAKRDEVMRRLGDRYGWTERE